MEGFARLLYNAISIIVGAWLIVGIAAAQSAPRVHVSNENPRWNDAITIRYDAPDSSRYANVASRDTIFGAALVWTVSGERTIVTPMRRGKRASYHFSLRIPDSAASVRIEICTPEDRVPDGITSFTCRTAGGKPTPGALLASTISYDSALTADLALYPTNYASYVHANDIANALSHSGQITRSDSALREYRAMLIARLRGHESHTPAWYLAMGELEASGGNDSTAEKYFRDAAEMTPFDPIYNDHDFWNRFFAPVMRPGGKVTFPVAPGRIIAPLIDRYPRTEMGKIWVRRLAYDTLIKADLFQRLCAVWKNSRDVDILSAIGGAFNYKKSPLYNPVLSIKWLQRAETCWRTHAGFYNGENIFGSMGRIGNIVSNHAVALATIGRMDEAGALIHNTMRIVHDKNTTEQLNAALASAYLIAGRLAEAQRAFGVALAHSTRGYVPGIEELYVKCKQENETKEAFIKRLIASHGTVTDLPQVNDFAFTTLEGKTGTLRSLRGKVVVLDCWFINCPGCEIEKNNLNALVDAFAGDTNIVFLSVARDNATALRNYLLDFPSRFQIVPDGAAICDNIGVTGYPTHIIIGRDGKTLGWDLGGSENAGELMKPKIREALGL